MDFGAIIKRAWHITWRYKALWVLGVFAGISGCQGSSPGSGGSDWQSGASDFGDVGGHGFGGFESAVVRYLPAIIAFSLVLIAIAIIWAILSVAARSGLIVAVNELEEGREKRLGELWGVGFSRFWPVVGLGLLLNLPMFVLALVIAFAIAVPFITAAVGGRNPGAEMIAPVCGSLVIGVPLMLVLGLILGILYLVGLRYVVIGGQGPIEAIGNSWRFFRIRFKDSALMYLLSGALNIAASIVFAIPVVIVFVALAFPAYGAMVNGDWSALLTPLAVGLLLLTLLGLLYSAVWGTFTSSLWTIFFRKVVGLEQPVFDAAPAYSSAYPYPEPPAYVPQQVYPGTPPPPPSIGQTAPEVEPAGPADTPAASTDNDAPGADA